MQCPRPSVSNYALNLLILSERLKMEWPLPFCSAECRETWWQAPTDEAFRVPYYSIADHQHGVTVVSNERGLYALEIDEQYVELAVILDTADAISRELQRMIEAAGFATQRFTPEYFTVKNATTVCAMVPHLIQIGPNAGFMYDIDRAVILFRQHIEPPKTAGTLVLSKFVDVDGEAFAFDSAGDIEPWWKLAPHDDAALGESRPRRCRRHPDGTIEWLEPVPEHWVVGRR